MAAPIKGTWFYLRIAVGGGFSTGIITDLIGKNINEIYRDGFKYRKVTGLPHGKQFNHDTLRGELLFDTEAAALSTGEIIGIRIEPGQTQQQES